MTALWGIVACGLLAIAYGVLTYAFVVHDFSVAYVATNSNSLLPTMYQFPAVWGAHEGFYLVLPLLGPSSLRDATGEFADAWADPLRIWAFKTGHDPLYYGRNLLEGFDNRAHIVKAVDDLRNNSLDYYAAVRSAYSQKRAAEIRNDDAGGVPRIPDYAADEKTDDKKQQTPR